MTSPACSHARGRLHRRADPAAGGRALAHRPGHLCRRPRDAGRRARRHGAEPSRPRTRATHRRRRDARCPACWPSLRPPTSPTSRCRGRPACRAPSPGPPSATACATPYPREGPPRRRGCRRRRRRVSRHRRGRVRPRRGGIRALPVVATAAAALAPGAPLVYDELGDNIAAHIVQRVGQPERAFAAADHTLRETFRIMRGGSHTMEGRGLVARYDEALDTSPSGTPRRHRMPSAPCSPISSTCPSTACASSRPRTSAAASGPRRASTPRRRSSAGWPAACGAPSSGSRIASSTSCPPPRSASRSTPSRSPSRARARSSASATSSPTTSACMAPSSPRSSPPAPCPAPIGSRTSTPRSAPPIPISSPPGRCAAPAALRASSSWSG